MKTKILLYSAALSLAACGTSSDACWQMDDPRYIPLEGMGDVYQYVDTSSGQETDWGSFASATLFYDDFALVAVEGGDGYGFMNKKGKILHEEWYRDATIFHDGIAWAVKKGGPLTAINKKGKVLFEFKQAETAYAFHEGIAAFSDAAGLWGLVDKKGKVIVEPQWEDVIPMVINGLIIVKDIDYGWCLAAVNGKTISEYYKGIGNETVIQGLRDGRIPVVDQNNKWGVIDRKGRCLINPQFDEIWLDGKNYFFRKGHQYGWCDKDGKYLINPQFSDAYSFGGDNLTAVEDKAGDWGFIDKEGKWVINAQFRKAMPFLACGIAPARDKNSREWGAVDKEGKWVINPQFRSLYDYGAADKLLAEDQSRNFGIIDADGKFIVSPVYTDIPSEFKSEIKHITAQSDYVDVEAYAALIEEQILALKSSTTGGLLATYGVKESKFPKSGGEATLDRKNATSDMTFIIKVSGINAWNKISDGWFGYNYTFRPDIQVNSYILGVEFGSKGKAWRFVDQIFDVLKKKYPYDMGNGTFTIPGYSLVFGATIPNGGMIFQVKTE